ncbi:MAG: cobyrinate a,c-diamide synthase [Bilifractor sp.]
MQMDENTKIKINRIMIAAPSSGSGKTLITCGLLHLLKKQGLRLASFKCGPDFIDPMFHTKVLGTKCRNLDTFFTDPDTTRALLVQNAADADLAVLEGVMGYFDGIGIDSSRAGASDLASITDTPVLLIIPARGVGRSIVPMIRGFLDFQEKKCIKGLILNHISPSLYPRMKEMIEREVHVPVVGYVPDVKDCALESRHLGLLMPDEIADFQFKLDHLSEILSKTLDLELILKIAGEAPSLLRKSLPWKSSLTENLSESSALPSENPSECSALPYMLDAAAQHADVQDKRQEAQTSSNERKRLRIGLAKDEAFCFFYADNLDLLSALGAELVPFSPIHDKELPEHLDGLLLHGGYPELYGKELGENLSMRSAVRDAILEGLPTIAECGGFLYLHSTLTDQGGREWPMAGVFQEKAYYTGHLKRFGYMTLSGGTMFGRQIGDIRSHEFHYYESENPGDAYLAEKPSGNRSWRCVRSTDTLYAGFPHLYFYANPKIAQTFLEKCREYHDNRNL